MVAPAQKRERRTGEDTRVDGRIFCLADGSQNNVVEQSEHPRLLGIDAVRVFSHPNGKGAFKSLLAGWKLIETKGGANEIVERAGRLVKSFGNGNDRQRVELEAVDDLLKRKRVGRGSALSVV